ncbi:histidine kinase [Actinotalea sp. AC32]|nr:histidine kinase [Actinotalea sp. AC32]
MSHPPPWTGPPPPGWAAQPRPPYPPPPWQVGRVAPRAPRPWERGAWWRRHVLGSGAVVTGCWFTMTTAIAFASQDAPASAEGGILLAWFVASLLLWSLVVRHRWPVAVCLTLSGAAILLPIDAVGALVAFSWVVARRSGRLLWLCAAATTTATALALARDRARSPQNVILSADLASGHAVVPIAGFVVIGVLCLALAVLWGLLRRWRERATTATTSRDQAARVAEGLRTEMTRQEERDVIAREVHDTVAHQLSLVSLQAAALEVSVPDGADDEHLEFREAARGVRHATHRALDELRGLMTMLRDPRPRVTEPRAPLPGTTLADLPTLLDEARAAGARVHASVFVTDGGTAPAELTRAVYRIVQESTTNALKHAPGTDIEVDVRAAPGRGVDVRVVNALVGTPPGIGSRTGIAGMGERARVLGGSLTASAEGDRWVVGAHLPWPVPVDTARGQMSPLR